MGGSDGLRKRVECSGMQIAGLQADDDGLALRDLLQGRGERGDRYPALIVGRHRGWSAQAQVTKGNVDGVVPLRADEQVDPRRSA